MMTLKEFKEVYFQELTNQQFSSELGFDNSFISKVMNGIYQTSKRSIRLEQLKNYILEKYNIEIDLHSAYNSYAVKNEELKEEITSLKETIKKRNNEIKELEQIIFNISSAVRLMSDVKDSLKSKKFDLKKYKAKYNRK